MNFLLDTNVVSEWTKPRQNEGVVKWLSQADEDHVFLSVVTFAELRFGVERMPMGARRDRLVRWITDDLLQRFESRIVSVTVELADLWGRILARGYSVGRPVSSMDALVAATAIHHEFTLVTRNVSDFEPLDVPLLNPWSS